MYNEELMPKKHAIGRIEKYHKYMNIES